MIKIPDFLSNALNSSNDDKEDIASNENTPIEKLKELAKDDDSFVRGNVAENINCSSDILEILANDEDFLVKCSALENTNCSKELLESFANNEDIQIVEKALHNLFNKDSSSLEEYSNSNNSIQLAAVASFENTSEVILQKLIYNDDYEVFNAAILNHRTSPDDIDKLYSEIKTDDIDGFNAIRSKHRSIAQVTKNTNIINELSKHNQFEIREGIVLNPFVSIDVLEKFLDDESPTIVIACVNQLLNKEAPKDKLIPLLRRISEITEFNNSTEDPDFYVERAKNRLEELEG